MRQNDKTQLIRKNKQHTVIAFLLSILILVCVYMVGASHTMESEQKQFQSLADSWVDVAQDRLGRIMAPTLYLEADLAANEGVKSFETMARGYLWEIRNQHNVQISSVAIAPGGVVKNVYPMTGNEKILGANLLDFNRPQAEAAAFAMEHHSPAMSAPVRPIPTADKLYLCIPLMREPGVAMLTLNSEDFAALLPLEIFQGIGAQYELSYVDQEGISWTLLEAPRDMNIAKVSRFELLGVSWTLKVMPAEGWLPAARLSVAMFIILMVSTLVALVFWSQLKLKDSNAELRQRAYYDALTLSHTRQFVNASLVDKETGAWKNEWNKYSLALVDVDNLKTINDKYGHELGDLVLSAVGELLNRMVNPEESECVIRHGGDEFVVLFNHILPGDFRDKLAIMVREARKLTFPGYPDFRVTLSIGGEMYSGCNPGNYEDMLNRADDKLYRAKESGRDQFAL